MNTKEKLEALPVAPWVIEMREYYFENGKYRSEDIQRLMGDPCVGHEAGKEKFQPENYHLAGTTRK
ncbi:MAG TPA: hypothetical protein VI078_14765 [bacterium]